MIRNARPKHPDSSKWYWLQWSRDELASASILTSSWSVPTGLTVDDTSLSGYLVGIRVSGGVQDQAFELVNQITTSSGETLHETLLLRINESGH